jgi:hypothetical protein
VWCSQQCRRRARTAAARAERRLEEVELAESGDRTAHTQYAAAAPDVVAKPDRRTAYAQSTPPATPGLLEHLLALAGLVRHLPAGVRLSVELHDTAIVVSRRASED